MATTATRNANTVYLSSASSVSTIDAVTAKGIKLIGVLLTTGAAADTLTLSDVTTTATKLKFSAVADSTEFFPLNGIEPLFPNGIRVAMGEVETVATLIIQETRS